ncbi:hypothetical protein SAMN04489842_2180 [Natronobacterium texcoconense]|uniref:Uncharacterized protein n=1 Tax=Natronobacterium texcoconense TaxID=1095778 RepID=A0A1H1FYX7_NATTX|nr:hypothetical protein SAMN04489842_2180 [Natronobacterium texcoconense]
MTSRVLANSEIKLCIGCDRSVVDEDTVILYQCWDNRETDLQSGYLCADCRQHIEAILGRGPVRECDSLDCANPFPESGRVDVREYDDDGYLQDISSICRDCLRRRYCSNN